jgi:hypothetical protein
MPTALALDFATRSHDGQRRDSDGAAFIEHPLEVAQLLRDAGCSEDLVAAGLLHDVLEDTDVGLEELTHRFGRGVADLVGAVSDDEEIADYRQRKRALREHVGEVGGDAALLFAADKISKVRELRDRVRRAPTMRGGGRLAERDRLRLEHYRESLAMLRRVAPQHALTTVLADELAGCRRTIRSARARSRRRVA